jgi:hypothetical protein
VSVIDITTFRLAEGVDEAAFLAVDERVRTGDLYQRHGLVRATTARADDGGWAVIVLWYEAANVVDLMTTELAAVVDASSVERRRYTTLD